MSLMSCYVMSYSKITENNIHRHKDLKSLVIYLPQRTQLGYLARKIVTNLVSHKFSSNDGIHLTVDKPYSKNPSFNIYIELVY